MKNIIQDHRSEKPILGSPIEYDVFAFVNILQANLPSSKALLEAEGHSSNPASSGMILKRSDHLDDKGN